MTDQKNTLLAPILSGLVLFGWQYFVGLPQMEKQKQIAQQQALERLQPTPGAAPQQGALPGAAGPGTALPAQPLSRQAALAGSPRVAIETPSVQGTIAL